jgi:hypothetical protein
MKISKRRSRASGAKHQENIIKEDSEIILVDSFDNKLPTRNHFQCEYQRHFFDNELRKLSNRKSINTNAIIKYNKYTGICYATYIRPPVFTFGKAIQTVEEYQLLPMGARGLDDTGTSNCTCSSCIPLVKGKKKTSIRLGDGITTIEV